MFFSFPTLLPVSPVVFRAATVAMFLQIIWNTGSTVVATMEEVSAIGFSLGIRTEGVAVPGKLLPRDQRGGGGAHVLCLVVVRPLARRPREGGGGGVLVGQVSWVARRCGSDREAHVDREIRVRYRSEHTSVEQL